MTASLFRGKKVMHPNLSTGRFYCTINLKPYSIMTYLFTVIFLNKIIQAIEELFNEKLNVCYLLLMYTDNKETFKALF